MGKHPYFPSVKSTWRNAQEYEGLTTPSNPASSKFKLYFKSDGQLYSLNSAGTEAVVGGSLGSDIQTAEIDDNAITLDKIYHGTADKVIGFDGSGIPTEITPVTASSTTTFTNKTITNPIFDSFNDIARITIPTDPSANYGRMYVKQIDANNDGLFIKVKKSGSYVEVQIV